MVAIGACGKRDDLKRDIENGTESDSQSQACRTIWSDWRREWDSNPRYGFPHTRFPSVRLKPLGHLS